MGSAALPTAAGVDEAAQFGAAERFREASVSPDGAWVAVVTTGAAHSAAWPVREGHAAAPAGGVPVRRQHHDQAVE